MNLLLTLLPAGNRRSTEHSRTYSRDFNYTEAYRCCGVAVVACMMSGACASNVIFIARYAFVSTRNGMNTVFVIVNVVAVCSVCAVMPVIMVCMITVMRSADYILCAARNSADYIFRTLNYAAYYIFGSTYNAAAVSQGRCARCQSESGESRE
jgi:hypothetical protein